MPSVDARPRFVDYGSVNEGKYAFANGVQSSWCSGMGSKYRFTENDKVKVSIGSLNRRVFDEFNSPINSFTQVYNGPV